MEEFHLIHGNNSVSIEIHAAEPVLNTEDTRERGGFSISWDIIERERERETERKQGREGETERLREGEGERDREEAREGGRNREAERGRGRERKR